VGISKRIKTRKSHLCYECLKVILPSLAVSERIFSKIEDDGVVIVSSITLYYHLRCAYLNQRRGERFERFKQGCQHPRGFRETEYSYIPGEAVMQPECDRCRLCGAVV
jgi:hypothetical protein